MASVNDIRVCTCFSCGKEVMKYIADFEDPANPKNFQFEIIRAHIDMFYRYYANPPSSGQNHTFFCLDCWRNDAPQDLVDQLIPKAIPNAT